MSETIRQWYRRTTSVALKALVVASVGALVFAVILFEFLPRELTLRLQIFNGAWTLPIFGGLWIVAFILLWLNPSREVMFRSQESMERMEARHSETADAFEERLDKVDRVIDYLNKAVDDDVIGKMAADMKAIREKIDRDTKGLPLRRRSPGTTNTEDVLEIPVPAAQEMVDLGDSNDNGSKAG